MSCVEIKAGELGQAFVILNQCMISKDPSITIFPDWLARLRIELKTAYFVNLLLSLEHLSRCMGGNRANVFSRT